MFTNESLSYDFNVFMPVVLLLLIGVIFVVATLLIGKLIRPHHPNPTKETPYECGEKPVGAAWAVFNVRFYVIGIIFIIFDVEAALMFPVVAVYKHLNQLGLGGVVLVEILLFILILASGLAYCWRKGDLDWVKSYHVGTQED